MKRIRALTLVAAGTAGVFGAPGVAGQEANPTPAAAQQAAGNGSAAVPLQLALQDALDRARKNSTQFQAALTTAALARQDRTQARNALLPTVIYNNSAIYTQSSGPLGLAATGVPVVFIANNAVHEYASQADIREVFD